ncbi:MAG: PilZ domain-containing protein [Myxococcaceae bacterium]|nr:PilZ domain-containing protein [Myxococcaceae bacterium]
MARAAKSKQGSSLAALAAGLDTRKKPLPADARPGLEALKDVVKARAHASAESAVAKPPPGKPPRASSPSRPRGSAPRVSSRPVSGSPIAKTVGSSPPAKPQASAHAPKPAPSAHASKPPSAHAAKPAPSAHATKPAPSAHSTKPASSPHSAKPLAREEPRGSAASSSPALPRAAALSSLQRAPTLPGRTPTARPTSSTRAPEPSNARRYPRARLEVRARLSLADDPSRSFEATLPTVNISVGGLFLESSFFLKLGTRLLVELKLPPKGRVVHVKAEVVRVETNGDGGSGFALRFTEYLDGSEVVLATHFLSPVLREFITAYAKQHRFDASAEYLAHTADVLAAWELKKAELGGDVWSLTSVS